LTANAGSISSSRPSLAVDIDRIQEAFPELPREEILSAIQQR